MSEPALREKQPSLNLAMLDNILLTTHFSSSSLAALAVNRSHSEIKKEVISQNEAMSECAGRHWVNRSVWADGG